MKIVSIDEAMKKVHSGTKIYVQGSSSTPGTLLRALVDHVKENDLRDIYLYHIELEGPFSSMLESVRGRIHDISLFVGRSMRPCVPRGLTEYMPIFLSDIPWFIREDLHPDITFINVSTPDIHGHVSLGPSVIGVRAAIDNSGMVIAQLNDEVPRTFGDSTLPQSTVDYAIRNDEKLVEAEKFVITDQERRIAENIRTLIPNRATIQAGIGSIPDAVMPLLDDKKDLGIHTELLSEGMIRLIESGAVTNIHKNIDRYHSVATFCKGNQYVYDFINENPMILFRSVDYTNDTATIRKNDRVISINSAVEVDISGQVAAESIGSRVISGVGGQMDFVRGAALSRGGKAIIALKSKTRHGEPKIVPFLKQGAAVTTTRNHVQFVVTEFGIADLRGKTLAQRAHELIRISSPEFRDDLEKYAKEILPNF